MKLRRAVAAMLVSVVPGIQLASAADISPRRWNEADRKRVEALQMSPFAPASRAIEGRSAILCDTGSPIAVHAGMDVLRKGGSAADAAATAALTEISTQLGSYVSYAGVLRLVYFEAKSGKVYSLDAGWNSYRGETDPGSIPSSQVGLPGRSEASTSGSEGRETLVPGFMAGIEAMSKRFGRLRFAQLFEPAIWYAENGVTVTPLLSSYFSLHGKFLERTAEGRQFLSQAGGDHPRARARFVQTELAQTLRGVAKSGAGYMYTGPWGKQFVTAVENSGGKATLADMAAYRPTWEEPLSTTLGEARVFAPGGQSDGGRSVLEALNFAQEMKLDQEQSYWNDPGVFNRLSRILEFVAVGAYPIPEVAAFERERKLSFTTADRVTKAYAKAMLPLVEEYGPVNATRQDPHHSAGVVVADRWGNVAALVHSINALPWGTTGLVVGGVPLSDAAGFQQYPLMQIKPGDRVPDDMAPVIAMKESKPVLAVASVGASLVPETVRIVLGVLSNHATAGRLLAAPPLLDNLEAPTLHESYIRKGQLVPEGAYGSDFLQKLRSTGVDVREVDRLQVLGLRGTAAFMILNSSGEMWGSAEDPHVSDFGDGY